MQDLRQTIEIELKEIQAEREKNNDRIKIKVGPLLEANKELDRKEAVLRGVLKRHEQLSKPPKAKP